MVKEELNEAMIWQKERNGIRCLLCGWNCFIAKDKRGYCQVRENKNNKLYTLNFGKVIASSIQPIEKIGLYHFCPSTNSFSFGSFGCNFFSQFCPSFEIEQKLHERTLDQVKFKQYSPDDIVETAEKKGCRTISYNYTEPAVSFEFVFRTSRLAQRSNIKNVFVTNGYIGEDAVKKITKYLDATVINIKASTDPEFYEKFMSIKNAEIIFDTLKQMKKHRVFIEITNLIVPQVGDNLEIGRKLAEYISNELGSDIPYHILQFHPTPNLQLPPTPVATLEKFADEARKIGLRYVYIGNVPGHEENTYCHNCREVLIQRKAGIVKKIKLVRDRCPNCDFSIKIVNE